MTVFSNAFKFFLPLLCFFSTIPCPKAVAAESVTLRLGFWQTTVRVNELEDYAKTGDLPPSLRSYASLVDPFLRELLQNSLQVEPSLARAFLDDLYQTREGKELLKQLNSFFINSSPEDLKTTLDSTLHENNIINGLELIKNYPSSRIDIDLFSISKIILEKQRLEIENRIISNNLIKAIESDRETIGKKGLEPIARGRESVSRYPYSFYDPGRHRLLKADIYYSPNTRGDLVIMSHGLAADRRFLRYLAYHLASRGLTVVSVEHPGSNIDALIDNSWNFQINNLLPAGEFIDRPKDISFILNELTGLNRQPGLLHGKFNTEKVTIIGHSFGGYTALALAGGKLNPGQARSACQSLTPLERAPADWLQCSVGELPYKSLSFRDFRIKKAILLNPIVGDLFDNNLREIKIPTLMLSSTEDGITPIVKHQLKPFNNLAGEKYLIIADGATHMSATDIIYLDSSMGQSTLVREVMDDRADPVRAMIKGVSLAFIERSGPDAAAYLPYLTPGYIESFSDGNIEFRLTRQLPESMRLVFNVLSLQDSPKFDDREWLQEVQRGITGLFRDNDFHTEGLGTIVGRLLDYHDRTFTPFPGY